MNQSNFHLHFFKLISVIVTCAFSTLAFAQANQPPIDAGALQQCLEKQLPMPSPLQLPQPSREIEKPKDPKVKEVRVDVKRFELGFSKFGIG